MLGEEVFMLLTLMDDTSKLPIAGLVAWVTPPGAQGNKSQGIGVHFGSDESGNVARTRIETVLAGHLNSARSTHSM